MINKYILRIVVLIWFSSACRAAVGNDIPLSIAERSGYTKTATEAEIDLLLEATANASDQIQRWTLGQSTEGRPIQSLKVGFKDNAGNDDRLTVVIIGGIHSGECAGKEALFDITRAVAIGKHAEWLKHIRLIVVPSLSPDSNSQRAVDNRPGQIGPIDGMGTRANAQGLDLNRDFIKLESPEIRSLVAALNAFDADVLIDLHTTNGSQHRYDLTYDPPHHPLTPQAVRSFLRNQLLPAVTKNSEELGFGMFYYGNFDRAHSRWTTYGYEGRYSTNYMGLRGKLGILSEAYSYATYQRRIEASRVFVEQILDYLNEHQNAAVDALSDGRRIDPGTKVGLTAKLEAFSEPTLIRGYRPDPAVDGEPRENFDYQVKFFGDFQPDVTTEFPIGYLIPAAQKQVTEVLKMHGIQFGKYEPAPTHIYEKYSISDFQQSEQAFQGHRMVRLQGSWKSQEAVQVNEAVWVDSRQPLGGLAAVLLQPESADSVATWNIVPAEQLQPGMTFPIIRVIEVTE